MTVRSAGRHRVTKSWARPKSPPSLLLVDYLESGRFTGRPIGPSPRASWPRFGPRPDPARFTGAPADPTTEAWFTGAPADPTTEAWFAGPSVDATARMSAIRSFVNWRMLGLAVSALLVGVAVALFLGAHAAPRSPGTGARHPTPPAAPATPPAPKPAPHPKHHTATPPPPATYPPTPSTAPAARPGSTSPGTYPGAAQGPPLVVRYLVASQGLGGFQGEITVTNNGTQPISGWQIAVALPDDRVLSFSNASGFVSNGILLLQPGPGAAPIPPRGGQLHVFFVAEGAQTIPQACAFNDVVCG